MSRLKRKRAISNPFELGFLIRWPVYTVRLPQQRLPRIPRASNNGQQSEVIGAGGFEQLAAVAS